MWKLPGPGIEPHVPCIGRQILNHWTTREVWDGVYWYWASWPISASFTAPSTDSLHDGRAKKTWDRKPASNFQRGLPLPPPSLSPALQDDEPLPGLHISRWQGMGWPFLAVTPSPTTESWWSWGKVAEGQTVGASAAETQIGSVLMRGPADLAALLIRLQQLQTQPRKARCLC